jgi:hypothetical protein
MNNLRIRVTARGALIEPRQRRIRDGGDGHPFFVASDRSGTLPAPAVAGFRSQNKTERRPIANVSATARGARVAFVSPRGVAL